MKDAGALVEEGIKAYMRGALDEAERLWRQALAADPRHDRAREYIAALARAPVPAVPRPAPAAQPAFVGGWDQGPAAGITIAIPARDGGVDLGALGPDAGAPLPVPPEAARADAATARDVATWMQAARELFALGDFSGSLELIERILAVDPAHAEATGYLRENEATLVAMYESKLGAAGGVPRVRVRPEEVLWLNLDHRAGFLLAQIDGRTSWDDLFALSNLPRLETARILARLVEDGVVAV